MAHRYSALAIRPLSREELHEVDTRATSEYGLPVIVLMENAGRGAAEAILEWSARDLALDKRGGKVIVLTGPGNNGGDGCVVARHLANAGVPVELAATHALEDLRGEHRIMRRVVERMGLVVHPAATIAEIEALAPLCESAAVIVDALLGTGFQGEVRPQMARVIRLVNDARSRTSPAGRGTRVVALDLPSGMDCDTGRPSLPTIIADLTVTFVAHKLGFSAPHAQTCLGEVEVVSIGAPVALLRRVMLESVGRSSPVEPGATQE
jgi:NAD(P)H-hydrate epimerase